jgi:hypothetical protein
MTRPIVRPRPHLEAARRKLALALAPLFAIGGLACSGGHASEDPMGDMPMEMAPAPPQMPAGAGENAPPSGPSQATAAKGADAGAADAGHDAAGDAGPSSGASGDAGSNAGEPPVADDAGTGAWTWVAVDGTQCADGTPTGVAINASPNKSGRLVVIFQWGGACWDATTCDVLKFASTGGYGEAEFKQALGLFPPSGSPLDRSDLDNPFKDDNFVFVPYCTADIHGGSKVSTYGAHVVHHHGFENVTADLALMQKNFPNPDRVVVTGLSAGGFGAAYNFWRFKDAYPKAQTFLIDDSGPPLPAPYASDKLSATWRESWGLDGTLPPGCEGCTTRFEAILDHYAAKYPDAKYGLISYRSDIVISTFYGISTLQFGPALDLLASLVFTNRPQFHVFYADGLLHTTLESWKILKVRDTSLFAWVRQMVDGDPAWTSVTP